MDLSDSMVILPVSMLFYIYSFSSLNHFCLFIFLLSLCAVCNFAEDFIAAIAFAAFAVVVVVPRTRLFIFAYYLLDCIFLSLPLFLIAFAAMNDQRQRQCWHINHQQQQQQKQQHTVRHTN